MGNGLVLKFKGNKSFVAFSNLGEAESLTKTWKVCTKVAAHLEQGQRLENLSWRLWHLQNLMVESDNAKSKREFRKLSKHMGEKLDKEKGRSIEELPVPRFHRNQSTDKVVRLAEEKERNRETHSRDAGGRLNRMQFTFSVDAPKTNESQSQSQFQSTTSSPLARRGDTTKFNKGKFLKAKERDSSSVDSDVQMDTSNTRAGAQGFGQGSGLAQMNDNANFFSTTSNAPRDPLQPQPTSLRFPSLFSDGFEPTALLYSTSDFGHVPSLSYGEGVGLRNSFGINRPVIEVPLDDLLANTSSPEDSSWATAANATFGHLGPSHLSDISAVKEEDANSVANENTFGELPYADVEMPEMEIDRAKTPQQQTVTPAPATPAVKLSVNTKNLNGTSTATTTTGRGRRASTAAARNNSATAAPPSASATSRSVGSVAVTPTSGKSECVNCGATHTPLWRRGLNDELNCNACGLYCKLHKRPRPRTMRQQQHHQQQGNGNIVASSGANTTSNTNTSGSNNAESGRPSGNQRVTITTESMGEPGTMKQRKTVKRSPHQSRGAARCVNCHTMATPLWRKDDEGKTVCNACGLYFKLHNSNRPISMKSDVIRKRSRHEQRIASIGSSPTPSASPGGSRHSSPEPGDTPPPTAEGSAYATPIGPDPFDPATAAFNFPADQFDFPNADSPQMNAEAIGGMLDNMGLVYGPPNQQQAFGYGYTDFEGGTSFPGPFHPDYLRALGVNVGDSAPHHNNGSDSPGGGSGESSDKGPKHSERPTGSAGDRGNKRRRLSTESYQSSITSTTEPPSSASSMFPLDNSSTASFSSIGLSAMSLKSGAGHRRNDSAQHSDISNVHSSHGTEDEDPDADFTMTFLQSRHAPMHPREHENEMMNAFVHNTEEMHPPMLPFSGYPDFNDGTNSVNNPNGGNEFMDVNMGLFNAHSALIYDLANQNQASGI